MTNISIKNPGGKKYYVFGLRKLFHRQKQKKKLRGFSPQSELYPPSDRRLSAKLVPTLADRGCRVVSATNPHGR
jgi:hypothetical protein